jgi:hypothetical protein
MKRIPSWPIASVVLSSLWGASKTVRTSLALAIATLSSTFLSAEARADTITVNSQSGPWEYNNSGLNSNFKYGDLGDLLPPTSISSIGGVALTSAVGEYVDITYLSGLVYGGIGIPVNPLGETQYPPGFDNANGILPDSYIPNGPSYVYDFELVGTFANSQGQIVGTPFSVGTYLYANGPLISGQPYGLPSEDAILIPSGATQLELGVNDNYFADNSGSWTLTIGLGQGPIIYNDVAPGGSVPEPSTLVLVSIAAGPGLGYLWLKRRKCPLVQGSGQHTSRRGRVHRNRLKTTVVKTRFLAPCPRFRANERGSWSPRNEHGATVCRTGVRFLCVD